MPVVEYKEACQQENYEDLKKNTRGLEKKKSRDLGASKDDKKTRTKKTTGSLHPYGGEGNKTQREQQGGLFKKVGEPGQQNGPTTIGA